MEKNGGRCADRIGAFLGPVLRGLWQSRTGDYLYLILAERDRPEGIYLGGYVDDPAQQEADGLVVMQLVH